MATKWNTPEGWECSVPPIILEWLRDEHPGLLTVDLEGEDDVYLLMETYPPPPQEGPPFVHSVHYIAGPSFLTACRVAESGVDNLRTLVTGGYSMELLVPAYEDDDDC